MPKKKLKKAVETLKRFHEDEEGWSMNLSDYVTTRQAAEMLGTDDSNIRHLLVEGRLHSRRMGHYWLVFVPSLNKYLETKSKRGRPASGSPRLPEQKDDGRG